MLYIGEKVGTGKGDAVDIAVDPIEGTRMTAMGQANALAVLAVGDKGCFLNAPDMYMEKLIVGPGGGRLRSMAPFAPGPTISFSMYISGALRKQPLSPTARTASALA